MTARQARRMRKRQRRALGTGKSGVTRRLPDLCRKYGVARSFTTKRSYAARKVKLEA